METTDVLKIRKDYQFIQETASVPERQRVLLRILETFKSMDIIEVAALLQIPALEVSKAQHEHVKKFIKRDSVKWELYG